MSPRSALLLGVLSPFLVLPTARGELVVTSLGRATELPAKDDARGTPRKWERVRAVLGEDADRVAVRQLKANLGGNTSVRNQSPLVWKDKGYFRRARDLGQVFTAPRDGRLDAIVLRTGNDTLAFQDGSAGAEVFVQFFEVRGTPRIDDNGTPPGTKATHGFSTNHRCDDFVTGVTYEPLRVARGGRLPDLASEKAGKLTYLKWDLSGDDELVLERGRRYAFVVGFVSPGKDRNFTLANANNAGSPKPPALFDDLDNYGGGWGLRREGNGATPPRMVPGPTPPSDPDTLRRLRDESIFGTGEARYALSPTCDGYPDVDTYRDLEFYLLLHAPVDESESP